MSVSKSVVALGLLSLFLLVETVSALVVPPLEEGWTAYRKLLVEKPILTKALTSAVIMTVSDSLTQRVEAKLLALPSSSQQRKQHKQQEPTTPAAAASAVAAAAGGENATSPNQQQQQAAPYRHNWTRTLHCFATGFVWSGPSAHTWYSTLEKIVRAIPGNRGPVGGLLLRIILDALIFSPVTIAGFFAVNSLIQQPTQLRQALRSIRDKITTKWAKAVLAAWTFWPVANIINFGFVPLHFRVLYANVMALFWSGYLSYINYQKQKLKRR